VAGGAALTLMGESLAALASLFAPGPALDTASSIVLLLSAFVYLSGYVGAAVAVPLWMHRCFRNLPALGVIPQRWSPAWAAGGWFIPFANLVIPYRVARELWMRTSVEQDWRDPLVQRWWSAWIASIGLSVASTPLGSRSQIAGGL